MCFVCYVVFTTFIVRPWVMVRIVRCCLWVVTIHTTTLMGATKYVLGLLRQISQILLKKEIISFKFLILSCQEYVQWNFFFFIILELMNFLKCTGVNSTCKQSIFFIWLIVKWCILGFYLLCRIYTPCSEHVEWIWSLLGRNLTVWLIYRILLSLKSRLKSKYHQHYSQETNENC